MARKPLVDYDTITAEYMAGLSSLPDLAKKYKCNRTALYNYIKKNNIKVDDKIKTGVSSIKAGIIELHSARDEIINDSNNGVNDKEVALKKQALMKGFEHLEKYGDFGSFAVGVAKKLLKKSNELLNEVSTPAELAQVASSTKTSFDLLGITPPKTPLVAIQNNINNATSGNDKKHLEIKIKFVEPKEKKDNDEIIDTELME